MFKKLLFQIAVLSFSFSAFSQTIDKSLLTDYLVTNEGDTIFCQVITIKRYADWVNYVEIKTKDGINEEFNRSQLEEHKSFKAGDYVFERSAFNLDKPDKQQWFLEKQFETTDKRLALLYYEGVTLKVNKKGTKANILLFQNPVLSKMSARFRLNGQLVDANKETFTTIIFPELLKCPDFKKAVEQEPKLFKPSSHKNYVDFHMCLLYYKQLCEFKKTGSYAEFKKN